MLQIISGKFFESDNIFHNECKGILYSNISRYKKETFEHVDLYPVDISNNISSYVVSYDLQLERQSESLSITKTGEDEIIRDLKNILSFGLDCVFDEDKSVVEKVCRIKGSGNGHRAVPSDFINGAVNLNKDSSDNEIDKCKKLFKHIIGLPREDYVDILNCLVTYNASIRLLNEDVNLAYSMLVYCLESLSQNYDFYEPKWEDYNQDKKNKLEKIFKSLSLEDSEAIRAILIKDDHFKLSRRFNNFAMKYLDNNYYERNDERIIINKNDVEIALSNAYNIRSKYAHMLKTIMRQLTMDKFSKEGDTFKFCHNTFFTYSGLLRTVRTVVYNFIFSLQTVVLQKFDWSKDLPGIITVELAPYFWLYRDVKDDGENAEHILEGLLKCLIYHRNDIRNMEKTIKLYFEHLPEMKKKISMLHMYWDIYTKIMGDITEENKNIFNNYINRYRELILLSIGTGLRRGELLALTWEDIDLENKMIKVNKSLAKVYIIAADGSKEREQIIQVPKTRKSIREVSFPDNLTSIFKDIKIKQRRARIKCGESYEVSDYVFTTSSGTQIDVTNLSHAWENLLKKCKLTHKKFHSLRHTFATKLFENEVALKTVSELLGHSSIDMTENTYTHVIPKQKSDAVEKLNYIFNL